MKISCFRAKAHLVFHWCLYNKNKLSPEGKCLDLLLNSLNLFFKKMYRDQFGEFVCGCWDLKGYVNLFLTDFNTIIALTIMKL